MSIQVTVWKEFPFEGVWELSYSEAGGDARQGASGSPSVSNIRLHHVLAAPAANLACRGRIHSGMLSRP
jgi:hypothetical protein